MADDDTPRERDDSGSKDRATVALVDAKVDGLRELIRAEFANVKEDVRSLAAVVSDVIKQGVQLDNHEHRLKRLEDGNAGPDHERRLTALERQGETNRKTATELDKDNRDWRRDRLPALLISAVVALGSIAALITQLH